MMVGDSDPDPGKVIAIDDIRLDDPALRSDPVVLGLVAATLIIAAIGIGWLIAAVASEGSVRELPAIRVQNQTHLALQLSAIDSTGSQLNLGTRPPGSSTVLKVVDMGPTWTFVASYGGHEVSRQVVPGSKVDAQNFALVIPPGATATLEAQGFR
jgi:hypothetical protein